MTGVVAKSRDDEVAVRVSMTHHSTTQINALLGSFTHQRKGKKCRREIVIMTILYERGDCQQILIKNINQSFRERKALWHEYRSREDMGTMYVYKIITNTNAYSANKKKGDNALCSLQVTQCNFIRGFQITGQTPSDAQVFRRLKETDILMLRFCSFNAT